MARLVLLIGLGLLNASPVRGDDRFAPVANVLERHCVSCHQGDKPKGGLDLSSHAKAMAGGESGPALVAGQPDESLLLQYISGDKPEMPKDAAPLKPEQVAVVRDWIANGADWPVGRTLTDKKEIDANWWSLKLLAPVKPPELADPWVRTPVDAFVLAKLREQKLTPSPEADRRTLIRRLSFDLHGLPPAPEEIDAFVNDTRGDAYERLVDRLLDSPRYGERLGRYWLDVMHFGESHGYDKDKPRPNAWPYRDYVIQSFNRDVPYDRFVAEQLAGDVLFPNDPQAIVATGFIAAGPWDFVGHVELREGTADKDIARSNDRDDMVANTMSTFASLTVHCARCHNHKFDPIRQEDYYALQAVFAGVDRADRPYEADAAVAERRGELHARQKQLSDALTVLQAEVAKITSPEITAVDAERKKLAAQLAALPAEKRGVMLGYHSQIAAAPDVIKWVQVDLGAETALDEIVLVPAHEAYGGHPGPGFGFPPRYTIEVSSDADFAQAHVVADHREADVAHPGDAWQRVATPGVRARYVRVTATRLWKRTGDWIFALGELAVMSGGRDLALGKTVTGLDSIEAAPAWAARNLVDGYSSQLQIVDPENGGLLPRASLQTALDRAGAERERLVNERMDAGMRNKLGVLQRETAAVAAAIEKLPPPAKVYAATPRFEAQGSFTAPRQPRPIHLLARGDVRSPQQLVSPAAPACVAGPTPTFALTDVNDEGQRRAALAAWLIDPRNALLRRSIVNRMWQHHFGQGLVDTPNDFGRMGSLPTHPELLEWLAGWFQTDGHSLKRLHRLLVTSATYRQSSTSRADCAAVDSGNRYLWRMTRSRLDAEALRDAMLAVSGKLDLTMGGPSVQQFNFKDDHSPIYDYANFDVDDPRGQRRSIYRFLVRSVPDPFMECLDCADPSIMTPKRNTTLTSIQALAMLNNPLAVRQAAHFAERLEKLSDSPAGQIDAAYRLALGRLPSEAERAALVSYSTKHGLASACRLIFNSNEFVFVE